VNTPKIIVAAIALTAGPLLRTASGQPANKSTPLTSNPSTITEACRDQDKLPWIFETVYLRESDRFSAAKIVLAYPITERKTNSQNVPYFDTKIPPGNGPMVSGYAALPTGTRIVLNQKPAGNGPAKLVSVEKLKSTVAGPRRTASSPPAITVIEPTDWATSWPMIQIKGASDRPLKSVRFDIVNSVRRIENQQGYVTDTAFDTARWEMTTNYFECMDIDLAPGTNTIVLRCEDFAGHQVVTNLTCVFRLDNDRTPPRISLQWPTPGRQLSGDSFTARGQLDDFTARITGRISADGGTKTVAGVVERHGRFWIEHLPLLGQTNLLELTATDAAGNSMTTNLAVIRSANHISIDPVPTEQLWQLQVMVTGKVTPADERVWLNGREATVGPDGAWVATGVALDRDGVAIFEAVAIPKFTKPMPLPVARPFPTISATPMETVSIQTSLSTNNDMILNVSQPAYGKFELHLTGTTGRSFILYATTNFVDWQPVQTNRNSGPRFDYSDTNMIAYGCRFFRVAPIE